MPRAVDGTKRKKRRKKILKAAKGFHGGSGTLFRTAKDAVTKAGTHAYKGRKRKKRDFRRLWIARISAACRADGITYSRFIEGLTKANIQINRKTLSNLAIEDPDAVKELIEIARKSAGV